MNTTVQSERTTETPANFTTSSLNMTLEEETIMRTNFGLNTSTILILALYALICIAGLFGNGLVIFVVLRYHKLKTVTNIYILNLSIADALFLIMLPLLITTAVKREWIFGSVMCKVYYMSTCINNFTSAFTLTIMAFDRYLATCHPLKSLVYRTSKYASLGLTIIWALSFLVMMPAIRYAKVVRRSCTIQWPDSFMTGHVTFVIYTMVIAFVMPVLLISMFYTMIILRLRDGGPGPSTHRRDCKFRKVTKLVTLIIAVFIICWLPHWAMQLYFISKPINTPTPNWAFRMYQVFSLLMYSNSMVNPLLYAFTNEYFRDAFRSAFKCLPEEIMSSSSRRTSAIQCLESAANSCQFLDANYHLTPQNTAPSTTTDDITGYPCANGVKPETLKINQHEARV